MGSEATTETEYSEYPVKPEQVEEAEDDTEDLVTPLVTGTLIAIPLRSLETLLDILEDEDYDDLEEEAQLDELPAPPEPISLYEVRKYALDAALDLQAHKDVYANVEQVVDEAKAFYDFLTTDFTDV